MLVVFSGIDGAGKSTQIKLLSEYLCKKNISFTTVWSRGGYTPGIEFIKKIYRKLFSFNSLSQKNKRDELMSNKKINYLWICIALLDLLIYYTVFLRLKILTKKIVICDRYLYDTFIDFSLNFPEINFSEKLLWKLLRKLSPKPNFSFLLMISTKESISRSKKKNDPFAEDIKKIEQRIKLYENSTYFDHNQVNTIDCMKNIDQVLNEILTSMSAVLNK